MTTPFDKKPANSRLYCFGIRSLQNFTLFVAIHGQGSHLQDLFARNLDRSPAIVDEVSLYSEVAACPSKFNVLQGKLNIAIFLLLELAKTADGSRKTNG